MSQAFFFQLLLLTIYIKICIRTFMGEVIPVHHMYNKCTTPLSHGVGPIVCGAHSM
jgi:hypothetical protein